MVVLNPCVLTRLLYTRGTCIVYSRYLDILVRFHQFCLRAILDQYLNSSHVRHCNLLKRQCKQHTKFAFISKGFTRQTMLFVSRISKQMFYIEWLYKNNRTQDISEMFNISHMNVVRHLEIFGCVNCLRWPASSRLNGNNRGTTFPFTMELHFQTLQNDPFLV